MPASSRKYATGYLHPDGTKLTVAFVWLVLAMRNRWVGAN